MIIKKLQLHNFGVYAEIMNLFLKEQTGGFNRRYEWKGKTTFLELFYWHYMVLILLHIRKVTEIIHTIFKIFC